MEGCPSEHGFIVQKNKSVKRTLHILLLAMLSCMSLLSCEKLIYEEGDNCDESVMHVSLRVSACVGGSATSRALSETEEYGTGYENFIDVHKLHILFFDTNNKFLQSFEPEQVSPTDNSEYPNTWELRGTIQNPPKTGFKIVALANWPSDPQDLKVGVTTIANVCKADWAMGNYKAPFTPSESSPIPMYGVKTIENTISFNSDIETNLGEINLLRAFAKITVCLSDGSSVELSSVTLSNYNKRFACAPLGMYKNTANSSLSNAAVHLAGSDNESAGKSLDFAPKADKKRWTIYIPEYLNAGPSGTARSDCSFIELKIKDSSVAYRIDFRDYYGQTDNGAFFNIVRNFEYYFEVKLTPILFSVTVKKWEFGGKVLIDM